MDYNEDFYCYQDGEDECFNAINCGEWCPWFWECFHKSQRYGN